MADSECPSKNNLCFDDANKTNQWDQTKKNTQVALSPDRIEPLERTWTLVQIVPTLADSTLTILIGMFWWPRLRLLQQRKQCDFFPWILIHFLYSWLTVWNWLLWHLVSRIHNHVELDGALYHIVPDTGDSLNERIDWNAVALSFILVMIKISSSNHVHNNCNDHSMNGSRNVCATQSLWYVLRITIIMMNARSNARMNWIIINQFINLSTLIIINKS